jgi:hypothetical protein
VQHDHRLSPPLVDVVHAEAVHVRIAGCER